MSNLLDNLQVSSESNVNVPSQANALDGLSSVNTEFKQTTTLEVGEHQTILKSITKGITQNSSEKLTFVFKDVKSNLCAIETLSFGSIDTHRTAFDRLKYLVSDKLNSEIVLPANPSMGIAEATKTTVQGCIQVVDKLFSEIIEKAKSSGQAYAITSEIVKPVYSADDIEGMSAEEIAEYEEEIEEAFQTNRKEDLRSKYDEARAKGFQIFRPTNSKISFALAVDKADLEKISPWTENLFQVAINKSFVIKIKQAGRYRNVTSIHPKSI